MSDELQQSLNKLLDEKTSRTTELSEQYADQNWLRGLVQGIPWAGGTLDTWMGAKAAAHQKRQIEKFIKETVRCFGLVEERYINKQFLESDEFFALFRDVLVRAAKTYDDEHIRLLSRVFVNSSISDIDTIVRDSIIDVLGNLKPAHIKVLRTLVENEPAAHYETIDSSSGQAIGGFQHASVVLMQRLHPELRDLPLEIICHDLARFDLLDWDRVGSFSSDDDVRLGGAKGYRPNAFGRTVVAFLTENAQELASTRITGT